MWKVKVVSRVGCLLVCFRPKRICHCSAVSGLVGWRSSEQASGPNPDDTSVDRWSSPPWTPVFEWPNLFDDWMSVLAKYAEEVESRKGQAIRLEPGGTKGADVLR